MNLKWRTETNQEAIAESHGLFGQYELALARPAILSQIRICMMGEEEFLAQNLFEPVSYSLDLDKRPFVL
jgi:hypothetical protein